MLEGTKQELDTKEERVSVSADEWQAFSSGSSEKSAPMTLAEIYKNFQDMMVENILARPKVDNELTKVQFLSERLSEPKSEELDKGRLSINEKDIEDAAKLQAEQITAYQRLNNAFLSSLAQNQHYIKCVSDALAGQDITPENVEAVIVDWKKQVESYLRVASGIDSESMIGGAEIKYPLPLELLQARSFGAFVNHCASSKFSDLTHDVRYSKDDQDLTKYDRELADKVWDKIEVARFKRLESNFPGIKDRVDKWNKIIPLPLLYDQIAEREKLNPFKEGENKEYRKERQRLVPGHEPSLKQREAKAVARDIARGKETLKKQHCELPEHIRVEMQFNLGIIPISKSRQNYLSCLASSVIGGEKWQTDFTGARMAEDMPVIFPARKEMVIKQLTPLFEKRIQAHKHLCDESSSRDTSESIGDSVALVTNNLKKFKI